MIISRLSPRRWTSSSSPKMCDQRQSYSVSFNKKDIEWYKAGRTRSHTETAYRFNRKLDVFKDFIKKRWSFLNFEDYLLKFVNLARHIRHPDTQAMIQMISRDLRAHLSDIICDQSQYGTSFHLPYRNFKLDPCVWRSCRGWQRL